MNWDEYIKGDTGEQDPGDWDGQKAIFLSARNREEQAEELKASLLLQAEGGADPAGLLYSAIKIIALVTNDPDFEDQAKAILDPTYKELAQGELFTDQGTAELQKRLEQQRKFINKLNRQTLDAWIEARRLEKIFMKLTEVFSGADLDVRTRLERLEKAESQIEKI